MGVEGNGDEVLRVARPAGSGDPVAAVGVVELGNVHLASLCEELLRSYGIDVLLVTV